MDNDLWTVEQTAEYLSLKRGTVIKMAATGRIPAVKIGGGWRFLAGRVQKWVQQSDACLVIVKQQPDADVTVADGIYYRPGETLPNGKTCDMGVYIGRRSTAENFVCQYGGLLITGDLA